VGKFRARTIGGGLALVLAVGVAACGADRNDSGGGGGGGSAVKEGVTAKDVKIGLIADLTGPTAAVQVPFTEGIKTQVEAANAAGGVNGRKITLLSEDEKYDVPTGLAAYKKLVSQTPALGIIGLNNSSLQVAAIKQVEQNKVPVFGAEATTKQAINPFNPYFFAMQCSYADQADVAVPYMAQKTGAAKPKVATLALDVESGYEWGDLIKARVQKLGGTYLGHTAVPPTATEADAQIQKIAKQKPDFIALHGSSNTATIVLKAMQKFDVKIPVIGIFATGGPAAYASVPPAVGNLFETVNCYTPSSIKAAGSQEMLDRAKQFGFEKSAGTTDFVNGYVVGQVLVDALKAAGKNPTRESFKKGLESLTDLDTGGLSENVTFGPNDHVGIQTVRPYAYDYATKTYKAVGEYADYKDDISNEYLGG
jgi:ABC-type branched-subunit amino acid transport system substrate-binding protein